MNRGTCAARTSGWAVGTVVAFATLIGSAGLAPLAATATGDEGRATYLGQNHYTGEFHAHTSVSDGSELPPDAFEFVHDETAADFFAVTEHDVMYDQRNGDDFIEDWRDADSEEWRYLHEEAFAFNASQDKLVAVPGIENTWYDGTGHINVFNTDWKATARAQFAGSVDGFANSFGTGDLKYDMYTFFARLKLDPNAIAQFNHPSTASKGNFFNFNGLDPIVDDRIDLIEVKVAAQVAQYQLALDKGWHLAPVYNGDEHSPNWVKAAKPTTGIWARGHTLDDLYSAMRDRSLYSTQDDNTVLGFSANGQLMGSILPANTGSLDFDIVLTDPDQGANFTSVQLIGNGGSVVHTFPGTSGRDLHLNHSTSVADGDFYYVKATQASGAFVVSAPIWIGETTRGANYAPVITVDGAVPSHAAYGAEIELPAASAIDDSGIVPTIRYEVYDSAGEVPVVDGRFVVRSYEDHFIVVKATDATGNTNAELLRITVDQDQLDPDAVFRYFGTTATVAEQPGGAGIAVSTDRSIRSVYAQVRSVGASGWSDAAVRTSTNDRDYEVNTIGRDMPNYGDQITGQSLRSHEFDLRGLTGGTRYEYRVGAASAGAPSADDGDAWTGVLGEFVAGGVENEPIYFVGDLQATTHDTSDLGLLRGVVDRLQAEAPGGQTLVQTGDLVDNGGRGQYWEEVFDSVFEGLDVQIAPVVGNHETYGDLDYNSLSDERTAIFSSMFNLPKNGVIGESNYSFDRGDVHVSILNSNFELDEQLAWLAEDLRASTAAWNVVSGHFSYYGGQHGDDPGMAADRAKVTKALDELGVDIYVGGHDHVYKRSTVYKDRLAANSEEEALGTTFVTLGSAGPKFYDNAPHWWDDVVFDENVQTGSVMEVVDDGLKITTYTIDGRLVDSYTVKKATGTWRMGSIDLVGGQLRGVGFLSSPGSRGTLTVSAATYDATEQEMLDLRSADVTLRHSGAEQFVAFDTPLPVAPGDTVKVFVWDSLSGGAPLLESVLVREGIEGHGTTEDPYLLHTAADFLKIDYDPAGHYLLADDIDFGGVVQQQIGALTKFTGVFDGGGHTISGFAASPEVGAGLFLDNSGMIRNLHVDGTIDTGRSNVAILADVNNGTIESSWVSGSIVGQDGVAGLAGYSYGAIRDSYSTATVTARGLYAGGAVAIARGGSITTNVYATGAVVAQSRNAGGVVSYGNDETVVEHSVALNAEVTAPSYAHAIVGRVADGQVAALDDNHVSAAVPVGVQSLTVAPAADNAKGAIVATAVVRSQPFYESLGWDFASTWQWNDDGRRPVLRAATEAVTPRDPSQQPSLPLSEDGRYLVSAPADLVQLVAYPAEDYRLAADIDLSGLAAPALGAPTPFSGELDGAGHTISGLSSATGGLFATMNGWVHDLGVIDATVSKTGERAGILADQSSGTIERVYTSGSITGGQRTGGIVGDSFGIIRDSYSLANVAGTGNRYSGGIAGITEAGSTTERVYATGSVTSSGDRSVAGISGYAYAGTVIRDSIALNSAVTGGSFAHRVVSRVGGDIVSVATLVNNAAVETLVPSVQSVVAVGPATMNGATLTVAEARSQATWQNEFGWDFGTVWQWSTDGARPILKSTAENVPAVPTGPALDRDTDGAYLLTTAADLAELAAWPAERFRLASDLDLAGAGGAPIGTIPFTGELDGAGHVLTGFGSTAGGLFATIGAGGAVHDLGVQDAAVAKSGSNVGILADTNRGTIERVYTSGTVTGTGTVGGIVGTSWATIRDSYSTAAATTTAGNYAGGIVGIAESDSTTERVYASGAVSGGTTAGGIAGYARNSSTIVRNSFAIGSSVSATGFGQRVVARAAAGQTATLTNNSAIETLIAATQAQTATGPATLNGQTQAVIAAQSRATWQDGLSWDFTGVWQWSDELKRPVLQSSPENAPAAGRAIAHPLDGVTDQVAPKSPEDAAGSGADTPAEPGRDENADDAEGGAAQVAPDDHEATDEEQAADVVTEEKQ